MEVGGVVVVVVAVVVGVVVMVEVICSNDAVIDSNGRNK